MVRALENVEQEAFSFRDREDSRPSPNIPRDGSQRGFRDEQTEQQRRTFDWDAVTGSFSGEEIASSAYLNPEGSGDNIWYRCRIHTRT